MPWPRGKSRGGSHPKPMVRMGFENDFWRQKMESERKTCLSRFYTISKSGDCFMAWGKIYIILWVEKRTLANVADNLFFQEGCDSPEDFIDCWIQTHKRGWTPKREVCCHHFMLLDSWHRKYAKR